MAVLAQGRGVRRVHSIIPGLRRLTLLVFFLLVNTTLQFNESNINVDDILRHFDEWHWKETTINHNNYLFAGSTDLQKRCYIGNYSRDIEGFNKIYDTRFNFAAVEKAWANPKSSNWISLERIVKKKRNTNETLNILFSGGSVLNGVGCLYKPDSASDLFAFNLAAWCSYPRRLVLALQEALNEITTSLKQQPIIVSSRVCSGNGYSSVIGLQYAYAKKYAIGNSCGRWVDYRFPAAWNETDASIKYDDDTGWMPDIYIWDHSVNDGNPKFFSKEEPRAVVYDALIRHMVSLPNKPQVIVFDSVISSPFKNERLNINNKLLVPTIDYSFIYRTHKPMSIWYATQDKNPHPGWPTHVIWAEILFYTLLKPLLTAYVDGTIKIGQDDDAAPLENESVNETMPCHAGYSTYLDFTMDAAGNDSPVRVTGNWSVSYEAGRRGWLYLGASHQHKVSSQDFNNSVTFRCSNISRGYIYIDYYKSYTPEWGRAVINITTDNFLVTSREIDSKWNTKYSIPYTEEIYLESVQHGKKLLSDIPHVDVTVSVIHGGKFKLVSIACC